MTRTKSWFDLPDEAQSVFLREFEKSLQAIADAGIVTINRPVTIETYQVCVTPFAIRAAEGVMNAPRRGARKTKGSL